MNIDKKDFKMILNTHGFILLGVSNSISKVDKVHEMVLKQVPNIIEEMMDEIMYFVAEREGVLYFEGKKKNHEIEKDYIFEIKIKNSRLYIRQRTEKGREFVSHYYLIEKNAKNEERM